MAEVSNNLAICQQKLGDFTSSEANYKKAIMLDGKVADFHYNLGVLYSDLGYFEPGIKILLKALELDKHQTSVYWHVVKSFMYQHRYQDALEVIDLGLLSNTLPDDKLCELLVTKAMLLWLFYSPNEVAQTLELSNGIYRYKNDSDNMNNMIIFHRYIKTLLQYRQEKPLLYQQDSLLQQEKTSIIPMYFISESHGFAPNDTLVNYKDQDYAIRSLFIFGAKIIHLVSEADNRYKASLSLLLSGLPAGSKLVMGFGEIDCRSTEGIYIYCVKYQLDFHDVIDDMLLRYVLMLQQQEKEHDVEIILYGVPAPHHEQIEQIGHDEEQTKFKQLIAYFNQRLMKLSSEFDFSFLDVYQLTQLNNESNLKYHTDDIHLKAETVPDLFKLTGPRR
ncbi:MAG: hypothetical protein JJV99_02575 [Colwellia sp.]|nr:hypothetical protein [Colwellia sp.]